MSRPSKNQPSQAARPDFHCWGVSSRNDSASRLSITRGGSVCSVDMTEDYWTGRGAASENGWTVACGRKMMSHVSVVEPPEKSERDSQQADAPRFDPYAMPADALREPPANLWEALEKIGPGIILAGGIICTRGLLL